MSKKLFLVLGNGFTIDFLGHLGKGDDVDVCNLFRYGSCVPWPVDGEPGFLSFKHCPNLWNLGARPDMSDSTAMELIEEIITCANVFSAHPRKSLFGKDARPNDIYLLAYQELSLYLKHLFIYYDKRVGALPSGCDNWTWCRFLQRVVDSAEYSSITIVTYNYDVWLERLLRKCGIPFYIGLLQQRRGRKTMLLKPHGSISFVQKEPLDKDQFSIPVDRQLLDGRVDDFIVRYEKLDANYLRSALIPPAGESSRLNQTWASDIRDRANRIASALGPNDEVIVCGLSYWHVDRPEIDELLVNCNPTANVKIINPKPPRCMSAVVTSIFGNYIAYNSVEALTEYIYG